MNIFIVFVTGFLKRKNAFQNMRMMIRLLDGKMKEHDLMDGHVGIAKR